MIDLGRLAGVWCVVLCMAATCAEAQASAPGPATAPAATTAPVATAPALDDPVKRGIIRVSQRQRIALTHETTVTLSEGGAFRIFHGLPVKRGWSIPKAEYGLEKLAAQPSMPQVKFDEKSEGYYFLWEIESAEKSGPATFHQL